MKKQVCLTSALLGIYLALSLELLKYLTIREMRILTGAFLLQSLGVANASAKLQPLE